MQGTERFDTEPGLDEASIAHDFVQNLHRRAAKFPGVATLNDHYLALSYTVRDRLLDHWVRSARTYLEGVHRTVVYLSAEYLPGPQLGHNLMNLGIQRSVEHALHKLGLNLGQLLEQASAATPSATWTSRAISACAGCQRAS